MRKKDREVELPLHGQAWRYLQVIVSSFDGLPVSAEKLRRYVDDKPQKLRAGLSELVRDGCLDAETMELTERGREVYEEQSFWKGELVWWMERLRVSAGLPEKQADALLDVMEPEVIQRIHIQNEYLRTLEISRSSQESFHNSDLIGKLMNGSYKVKVVFLDQRERQGESNFSRFSSLSRYFSSQAALLVEPLKSALTLAWDERYGKLEEARYLWEGKERHRRARENQLSIPVADFRFTHVRSYELLEGTLDLAVKYTDGEGRERTEEASLLISLPLNGRK